MFDIDARLAQDDFGRRQRFALNRAALYTSQAVCALNDVAAFARGEDPDARRAIEADRFIGIDTGADRR